MTISFSGIAVPYRLLLIVFLLLSPAVAQTTRPSDVVVPLQVVNNLPLCAEVKLNGENYGLFLIDTGSNISFISTDAAKALRLEKSGEWFSAGNPMGPSHRLTSLSVGPLEHRDVQIASTDLKMLQVFKRPLIGVLGTDLLGRQPFTLDYRRQELILYTGEPPAPPEGARAVEITLRNRRNTFDAQGDALMVGCPVVPAKVNGVASPLMLASGVNWGFAVADSVVRQQSDRVGRQMAKSEAPATFSSEEPPRYFQVDELTAAGVTLRDVARSYTRPRGDPQRQEEYSLIGGRLLCDYRSTFDLKSRQLWMVPSPVEAFAAPDKPTVAGTTPLLEAVRGGDEMLVRQLLKSNPSLASVDGGGFNALHLAVRSGSTACFRMIIERPDCPKIDAQSRDRITALMLAAADNEMEMAKELIRRGADVNAKAAGGAVLHYAVEEGYVEMARLLLDKGANVSATTAAIPQAIVRAVAKADEPMADLLRQHGAKADAAPGKGENLVHVAAYGGSVKLLQWTIDSLGKEAADKVSDTGYTPLMIAVTMGKDPAVKLLLDLGVKTDVVNNRNAALGAETALHMAARAGHLGSLKLLLQAGMPLDQKTGMGLTPLILASREGHGEMVQYLIEQKADVKAKDEYGMSAVFHAALRKQTACIERLIQAGAEVSQAAPNGLRPLDVAANEGDIDTARLLVAAGADPLARGSHGFNAVQLAARKNHAQLSRILQEMATTRPTTQPQ